MSPVHTIPRPYTDQTKRAGEDAYQTMVREAYRYFDAEVLPQKARVAALWYYKTSGYELIRALLTPRSVVKIQSIPDLKAFLIPPAVAATPAVRSRKAKPAATAATAATAAATEEGWADVVARVTAAALKTQILPCIAHIRAIDELVRRAPRLSHDCVVYRGLREDFQDQLECAGKKHVIAFPAFVSTSFSPSVARRFSGANGCTCTIHLPKGSMGTFLFSMRGVQSVKHFEDGYIDSEREFLLPRGCRFEVAAVDYYPNADLIQKYKDFDCKPGTMLKKNYTLRLVSQPTAAETSKDYARLRDRAFDVELQDLRWLRRKKAATKAALAA